MRSIQIFIVLALLSALIVGCGREAADQLFSQIRGEEGKGHIRGVSIGMSKQEVLEVENGKNLQKKEKQELKYSLPLWGKKGKKAGTMELFYSFDQFGLFEIQVDVMLEDKKRIESLFDRFFDEFEEAYGQPYEDHGYTTWITRSQKGNEVEVSLIHDKQSRGEPFLSITFFERYDEEGT